MFSATFIINLTGTEYIQFVPFDGAVEHKEYKKHPVGIYFGYYYYDEGYNPVKIELHQITEHFPRHAKWVQL